MPAKSTNPDRRSFRIVSHDGGFASWQLQEVQDSCLDLPGEQPVYLKFERFGQAWTGRVRADNFRSSYGMAGDIVRSSLGTLTEVRIPANCDNPDYARGSAPPPGYDSWLEYSVKI